MLPFGTAQDGGEAFFGSPLPRHPLALLAALGLGRGPNIVKSKCSQGICINISFLMGYTLKDIEMGKS